MTQRSVITTPSVHSDIIPDFCSAKAVLISLLLAELLALLITLANVGDHRDFWPTVGLNCLFIVWVALPSQALLCIIRNRFPHLHLTTTIFIAFVVMQGITFMLTWICYSGSDYFALYADESSVNLSAYLRNSGISLIVSLILLYHLYIQASWKKQVQAELNARLQALQSRIQPHFLFNSLNTIASTVHSNPGMAEDLIVDLSELMRAGLNTQNSLVTLANELRLVDGYLNIESQRVGHRLSIEWNIDESVSSALIPPMSVQPLVENAVYHGIEPSLAGGTIEITTARRGRSVVLMVRNSNSQNDQQQSAVQGHGIALNNVTARVKGWFGDEGKVVFSTVDGWFQARIIIPYVTSA